MPGWSWTGFFGYFASPYLLGGAGLTLALTAATLVLGLLLFPVVDTRDPVIIGVGLAVTLAVVALCYGPAGACTLAMRETATAGSLADREPVTR